ncbi:hypothetical protein Taro_048265 [Colocasia esculenta]|uniref:Protein RER1 n=1 Tax=Colocasia esculenta TaxID=4460 RepID=A0A843WXY5_COLES|nr:hypothetical protein [Colocasia esculenta]
MDSLVGGDGSPGGGGGIPYLSDWGTAAGRRYQYYLDKAMPHMLRRWAALCAVALVYVLRVGVFVQGFYVVSYGLGIYILNLFIAFLSPQVDPEIQELLDTGANGDGGPLLPTRSSDEFRPFVRRLPEFKFCVSGVYKEAMKLHPAEMNSLLGFQKGGPQEL